MAQQDTGSCDRCGQVNSLHAKKCMRCGRELAWSPAKTVRPARAAPPAAVQAASTLGAKVQALPDSYRKMGWMQRRMVRYGIVYGGIAILAILARLGCIQGTDTASGGNVTMAKYNQVQKGMTYEQCVAVIGHPGTHRMVADDATPSKPMEQYDWFNSDDTGMTAEFQDGKLVVKDEKDLE